jgi:hypothetical protein
MFERGNGAHRGGPLRFNEGSPRDVGCLRKVPPAYHTGDADVRLPWLRFDPRTTRRKSRTRLLPDRQRPLSQSIADGLTRLADLAQYSESLIPRVTDRESVASSDNGATI